MNRKLSERLLQLRRQIDSNPKLQVGLLFILLLVGFWLFDVLGSWRAAQVNALADSQARLQQVKQLAGQQAWISRAQDALRLQKSLEAEIPSAPSPGLAQANFQARIQEVVASQGASLRVDMQAPVRLEDQPELIRVTAVIVGSLPPSRVTSLAYRLESSTSLVILPALLIHSDDNNQTFSMTVQSFFRVPAPSSPTGTGTP